MAAKKKSQNGKKAKKPAQASRVSLDDKVWAACDIMRRSNCSGALNYVPELTWILFLRILDEQEQVEQAKAKAVKARHTPTLVTPYRWRDWAAPEDDTTDPEKQTGPGWKRKELTENGKQGAFKEWVNDSLLKHLKGLKDSIRPTARQKVVSEILSGVERVRIDTDRNLLDVLDVVHEIQPEALDDTHIFALSQVYEGLLAELGEKGGDGGQFFTPREIIRAVVKVVDPKIGETLYDPSCGTGGFHAQAYEYMAGPNGKNVKTPRHLELLRQETFFGREKENLIYPIALANLALHGIDLPRIWHGNTLTGEGIYDGLWGDAPDQFDVILTNPPFGGKEGRCFFYSM